MCVSHFTAVWMEHAELRQALAQYEPTELPPVGPDERCELLLGPCRFLMCHGCRDLIRNSKYACYPLVSLLVYSAGALAERIAQWRCHSALVADLLTSKR